MLFNYEIGISVNLVIKIIALLDLTISQFFLPVWQIEQAFCEIIELVSYTTVVERIYVVQFRNSPLQEFGKPHIPQIQRPTISGA